MCVYSNTSYITAQPANSGLLFASSVGLRASHRSANDTEDGVAG